MARIRITSARASLSVVSTVAMVVAAAAATSSAGAAAPHKLGSAKQARGVAHTKIDLNGRSVDGPRAGIKLPRGVPSAGKYAFLLRLDTAPTLKTFRAMRASSSTKAAASSAAEAQLSRVKAAQSRVISALPADTRVLYRMQTVLAAVAVSTNVRNYAALSRINGVTHVYPIAPKTISNSYAVPLQQAPEAWTAHGDLGARSSIAIIDTGIDYTHANFGGPGTVAAYQAAHAHEADPADPSEFPSDKIIGGTDLVGDNYDATSTDAAKTVPHPDPNPLDCNGHGSHVAGSAAGLGENADGSTYTGPYNDTDTPFDTMRIGPGIAPMAKLYAFRVFGCEGSTDVVSEALDLAADPNGDGDPSDHVDVVNMSLGSDFGAPDDGDSVASDAASQLGITVAVASGNANDVYDVGGSPGNAPRVIGVAASTDAQTITDLLDVSAPANIAAGYNAERSLAYDWANQPDLAGDLYQMTEPSNLDGCDPYNADDAAGAAGKIVFLEWTDDDATRRCGSVARGDQAVAAGAIGFVFADDENNFAAGITGSDTIPGVLITKDAGDAIRPELVAGSTVTISGTEMNAGKLLDTSRDDGVTSFSSRGIRSAGDTKPDVAAVGDTVFSTASGTGNEGTSESGTSMATPMVAGTAALVKDAHPDWTPEQVKADIMNTAVDLFDGPNHTGDRYAPNRVGAGRIDVAAALNNDVLAYVTDDPGVVTAAFGSMAITAPTTLTKTIKLQNTGLVSHTYAATYVPITEIPGADYTVTVNNGSADAIVLGPRSSAMVTVTLSIDPSALTKTIDPTVDRDQGGLPRQYVADASGLVRFTTENGSELRVPVYSAPRPASTMSQASTVTLPAGRTQDALLKLSGHAVNQGTGDEHIQSLMAGFELALKSGKAPACSAKVTSGCVSIPEERAADLKDVGVTSTAPQVALNGGNPSADGIVYFAVSTRGPWRTASDDQEFDILMDVDGDGVPDAVTFNTRLSGTDVLVDETIDLQTGDVLDIEALNDTLGDTDTAMFDSDTLVMPVAISALGLGASSRISYGIASFSPYQSDPIDAYGFDAEGNLDGSLTTDVLHPGVAVFGTPAAMPSVLFPDSPASVVKIERNRGAYATDHGLGALIVHFHNTVGNKAQVVALKSKSKVSLKFGRSTVKRGTAVNVTMAVANDAGTPASGRVQLIRTSGAGAPAVSTRARLKAGKVTVSYRPSARLKPGTYRFRADYAGDANYTAGSSSLVRVKITK
jgi:subtilisin family serine protease